MCSLLRMKAWASGYSLLGFTSVGSFICSSGYKLGGRMMSSVSSAKKSSSRVSPWLMLPPTSGSGSGDMVYNFYSLAEDKVVSRHKKGDLPHDDALLVGSSHGWLVLLNIRNCDLFLFNPLTGRHIKLPPIHTLPVPQENLKRGFGCVSKVIISCPPDDDDDQCRAMMSFGPDNSLAFCWPGHSAEWTPIGTVYEWAFEGTIVRRYEDFVYSRRRKRFFCVTEYRDFEAWDLGDPESPRLDWSDWSAWLDTPCLALWKDEFEEEDVRTPRYLVFDEDANQLIYVKRNIMMRMDDSHHHVRSIYFGKYSGWDDSYPYKTLGFEVRKIDWDGGEKTKWTNIQGSLDGLAIFLGINHTFAIQASEYPELKLKPNCIYFTDQKELTPPRWVDRMLYHYGGHDIGIFDYQNKTISACYYPCDVQSIKRITPAPLWFTPSLN